jgi:hypothetical protein
MDARMVEDVCGWTCRGEAAMVISGMTVGVACRLCTCLGRQFMKEPNAVVLVDFS